MIIIPGRYSYHGETGDPVTWWGGLIYAIGVFSYFIGWLIFMIYILFFL